MEKNELGRTGLKISPIVFGSWAAGGWMWGGTDVKASIEAIRASLDCGVSTIDTAPVYGQGESEEIVGQALQGVPRDRVQILTKFGLRWEKPVGSFYFKSKTNDGRDIDIYKYAGKESIIKECEESLRRLKTDYIDLYQIHWHDETTPIAETMEALIRLKENGKIRAAGVCNYKVDWMKTAEKTISLASNQMPYSMLNRKIESDVVPYCSETGKSVLAYSPLERGLLTGKMRPGQRFNEGDHRATHKFFTDENIKRINSFLDRLRPIAESKKATLGQLVIRWTMEQPGITAVLAGARNAQQAVENANAINLNISNEEMALIGKELSAVTLV